MLDIMNMGNFIFGIIGLVIGAVFVFLLMKGKRASLEAKYELEKQKNNEANRRHEEALNMAKEECNLRIAELKKEHENHVANLKEEHANALRETKKELAEQRMKELTALRENYETQLKLLKEEMTTATETLLKSRSSELQKVNSEQMEMLFRPLKDNIARMEKSMNENRDAQNRNNASFEKTIQQMMESNARLGSQADRLSTALQRKNKTAGNWGELILSELLESQGLRPGIHFDVQQTMKDETGQSVQSESGSRLIPDVILHLADNRDVVIDSKMSLTAYVDYQNAEDENARQEALSRHIESVRNHFKELSVKDYSHYIAKPKTGIDFVIMFVPIEGALQLALAEEPKLWHEAFEKKVFIASGQTLIAALRIIDLTWVNVLQERNTERIMDEARKLIDRVAMFYDEFQDVGKKIGAAADAYSKVQKRVNDSNQSILATGHRLEALGARGKKALPTVGEE